jgi:hypothetical protein
VFLNDFPAIANGGRRGVPWCTGYQSEGSFALEAECHIGAEHIYLFSLCKSVGSRPLSTIYVPLVFVHQFTQCYARVDCHCKKYSCLWT